MIILTATKRFLKEPTCTKPRPKRDLHPDYKDPITLAKFVISDSLSRLSRYTRYILNNKSGRRFTFEFNIELWGYPEFNECHKALYAENGKFKGKFDSHNIFNILYDDLKSRTIIIDGSPMECSLHTVIRNVFEKHIAGRPEIDGKYFQYLDLSIFTLRDGVYKVINEYGFNEVTLGVGPMIKYCNERKERPSIKIKFSYDYDMLKAVWGKKQ